MIEIPFDPDADALLFECVVEFQTIRNALMALDTGASTVTFSQEILESIGYDLDVITEQESFGINSSSFLFDQTFSFPKRKSLVGNASCEHTVPKVTLTALNLDKAKLERVEALCYTLPDYLGIDGVIGLNYLRRFKKVILDFENGILTLEEKTS